MILKGAIFVCAIISQLISVSAAAGPLVGIGAGPIADYTGEVVFADAMAQSRQWDTTNLDENGWPRQDASIYVWADASVNFDTSGTYALSFEGQADVTGATVAGKSYDATANITTGTITLPPTNSLLLTFTNTRRNADSAMNTGVAHVKLMRPITPGSSTFYSANTVFTPQAKQLYSKFNVVRFMDWLATNANPSVSWSDRTKPTWATQSRWNGTIWSSSQMGASWEYAVQLCNETGTDMWINIPVGADDDYITKVAQLIAYGSDGNLPYTVAQASPLYPPLNSGLKVYIEFSNEVWNTGGPFTQSLTNHTAAQAEVAAGSSPLNFDGATGDWDWAARRSAKRTVEISNLFRAVFGDGAMMSRIRPVLESQQGYTGWWLFQQSRMLEDYYNNAGLVSNPHPPSYYIYGGAGSAYYGPQNDDPDLTIDSIWSSGTNDVAAWIPLCVQESAYAVSLYGHRVAYEGGPSMDSGASDPVKQAAWNDTRMTTSLTDHQSVWQQTGGDLLVYYKGVWDYQWGFTRNVYTLNTPKLAGIDQIDASTPAVGTSGSAIPGSIAAASFLSPESWSVNPNSLSAVGTSGPTWLGYLIHNMTSGDFGISLTARSTGTGNRADVYLDGALVGTITIPDTSGNGTPVATAEVTVTNLAAGTHGLKIKAKAGVFALQSIVVNGGSTGNLPGAPGALNAMAADAQVHLSWAAAAGAATYIVYRGTVAGSESPTPVATGVTTNSYTDSGVGNGITYFYVVAGVNANGTGPQSNEASATPASTASAGIGPQVITSIRFYPRAPDAAWRMEGGLFQGSNDNATWTTLVSMVGVYPPDNAWTTLPVADQTAWRYVRFLSSSVNTYDALNIAELEFYNGNTNLTGTGIGTPGSYQNDPALTFDKALDGDIATYVDNVGGAFVGLDFGAGSGVALPAAPTGLAATSGNAQNSLTWTAAVGAITYNVYRGTTVDGENATPVASGIAGTTYNDPGLVNGVTYYYKVAGVSAGGAGPQSNEASATPTTTAPAGIGPQVVTSIRFYPRPDVAWQMQGGRFEASNDDVNWTTLSSLVNVWPADNTWTTIAVSDPTAWRYVRFVSSSVNNWEALNIAELEFYHGDTKLTGVGVGSPGSYQNDPATTFDKALDGNIATFVDNVGGSFVGYDFGAGSLPPATLSTLTAAAGAAHVVLSWTATGTADSYNIYRGTNAGGENATPVATGVTTATYNDGDLANGTTYFYTVAGVNSNGTGVPSNEASATPLATLALPVAPTALVASGGDGVVALSWTAAENTTSYNVYRGTSAGGEAVTPVATGVTATTYSDAGRTNTTTYYYQVAAVNANGAGPLSNEASATPTPPDSAPMITLQPVSRTTAVGATAIFTVQADGLPAPTFQWRKDGVAITGNSSASTATLALNAIMATDAGSYDVIVTNGLGFVQSSAATLTVGSIFTPSTGRLGINTGFINDWTGEVIFADAMKTSRTWDNTTTDANGWPQTDSSIYVWAGTAASYNSGGTYALSFNGQATVTGATLTNKVYDAATNTTTASIVESPNTDYLQLTFSDTKRLPGSETNTGVTNVKLMRPIEPGSAISYNPDTVFTTQSKALYSKFSAIRYMNWLNTNGNPSVNWSERTLPDWASQFRWQGQAWSSPQMGAAWEYAVKLSNETNTDMWICVPVGANDDYVSRLAKLIAYGSDGINPYESHQANPVWAPLNPGLKVYVEFSNEVWNTAGAFTQSQTNHTAAQAEVAAGNSPLNFDGAADDWIWAARRSAKRTVEISNIFRGIFGDNAMMNRIRPVLQSQQAYTGFWALEQAHIMEEYYNNPARVPDPRPPQYYVYGSGGSAYYGPDNSSQNLTIDNIWTSGTFDASAWEPVSRNESAYALNLYGHRVAYEGGPAMDSGGSDVAKEAAWNHPLMTGKIVEHQVTWDESGGELLMFYVATGDFQWGFTSSVYDLNTAKLKAIDRINATAPAAPAFGSAIPAVIPASARVAPEANVGDTNNLSVAGGQALYATSWIGYVVRNEVAATFAISLQAGSAVAGSQADIYIDGSLAGTVDVANTGSNSTGVPTSVLTVSNLPAGAHGLVVKAKSGSFGFQSIIVTSTPLSGTPGTLAATAGATQVSLMWTAASDATSYNVYRGTSAGAEALLTSGIVATSYVDTSVTNGTKYYYTVAGVNAGGVGLKSNEVNATPSIPTPAAPTDLIATAADAQVSLSWKAAADATTYSVYRGTAAGGENSTPIAVEIGSLTYVDTGLTNGLGYYYTVAGVNESGVGAQSAEASAQPIAPSTVPVITRQPVSQTKTVGASVSFSVEAGGVPAPVYQWRKDGAAITGNSSALTPVLVLDAIDTDDAGSYDVRVSNSAGVVRSNAATLQVHKAAAEISLTHLEHSYDGTPHTVSVTTVPADLNVKLTYNGSSTAPIYPGRYAVEAKVTDPDFTASAQGTLVIRTAVLVRHAPTINGGLDGSIQVLLPEAVTLNGSAWISGDLLMPGSPSVKVNGRSHFGGTVEATGRATPANYKVTLNGGAVLSHLVRRVDAIAMPILKPTPQPVGTRNVTLNKASDSPGGFSTLRNLTLNGSAGEVSVPPGTYGIFVANGRSGFVFGVAGAEERAVYNLQGLTLNGNTGLTVAGPVVIHLAHGITLNASMGSALHPKWLKVTVSSGGVTVNGNMTLSGSVIAPGGTVIVNGNSTLTGRVVADQLTVNGNAVIQESNHELP